MIWTFRKKYLASIVAVIISINYRASAQNIGINTSGSAADASAGLDINFNNKGVLIPRVTLQSTTDATTITSPSTSLLVYSSAGVVSDGYYYNSGTSWLTDMDKVYYTILIRQRIAGMIT